MQRLELAKRDFVLLSLLFFIIFCIHIFVKYQTFKELKSHSYIQKTLKVEKIYYKSTKKGKTYRLLRLKGDEIFFFGLDWKKEAKVKPNSLISCKILTKHLTFYNYLKGFFTPIFSIKILSQTDKTVKSDLSNFIVNQHQDSITKELFTALFLGEKIDKNIRQKIQLLGISHLIAISGFHLGVLATLLYIVFVPLYRYFQDRYFPYRSLKVDFMLFSSFVLLGYLYLVGFLPSLIRAYIMMMIGYIFYIRHIKILSFETLFLTGSLILAFFPTLLFSISFWFSIWGVFYIFLFLKYFEHLKAWQIFIAINFWVFVMMMPIVHFIFPTFSLYQLLSPLLSIAFVVFYPLELVLHLVKEGDLLDGVILKLLSFEAKSIYLKTHIWFLALYITSSLLAIYKRYFLYLTITLSGLFFIYMLTKSLILNP